MAAMTSSSYPPPPPYFRLYGDYIRDPNSAPEPPPPIGGPYQLFGATYTVRLMRCFQALRIRESASSTPKAPTLARATLSHSIESQIQRRKQAVEDIKRRREEAQKLLKEALQTLDGQMA